MNKKLTKSANNVVLTGTLAGIGEWIGIDPTVVRIIYVIACFLGFGSPILLYILLAILIPAAKKQPFQPNNPPKRKPAEKIDEDDWSDF